MTYKTWKKRDRKRKKKFVEQLEFDKNKKAPAKILHFPAIHPIDERIEQENGLETKSERNR